MKQQSIGYDSTNGSYIYLNNDRLTGIVNENNQLQVYNLNDEDQVHHDSSSSESNDETYDKIRKFSLPVVPTPSNVDDIFQLLSQKIAKYCQILSDLTNCEVFYKAQLPITNQNEQENKPTRYMRKNERLNKQHRSLYWGTHQMIFEYSHNNGIRYDKAGGDSLIKLNQRSFSNNVNDLIEEILNGPNLNDQLNNKQTSITSTTAQVIDKQRISQESDIISTKSSTTKLDNTLKFKDCCVYMNRLDESVVDSYLNKFEYKNSVNEDLDFELPNDEELYSDLNCESTEIESDEVKNLNIIQSNNNTCENCHITFKHLTQFKLHYLQNHDPNYLIINNQSECPKCKYNLFGSKTDRSKHLLTCFYPDIYTCKQCSQSFDSYKEYLIHTKYVHTNLIYMCLYCKRKYKTMKELQNHEQLLHTKSINYCEICFELLKSRHDLYEHYKLFHLTSEDEDTEPAESYYSNSHSYTEKPTSSVTITDDFNEIEAVLLSSTPTTSNSSKNIISLDNITIDHLNNNNTTSSQILLNDSSENFIEKTSIKKIIEEEQTKSTKELEQTISIGPKLKLQKNDLIRGLIDRKHQCKWCSLRFYTKSQLKAHESTHNNAVLICPVCDKQFHHKDRLTGHMKCHMEPSLECKVCGKKFKRLCNLYNHELVHGLTEHAFMLCQFCGRGFRSRRDYQNHVIANHRDLIMKSEEEDEETTNDNQSFNNDESSINEEKLNKIVNSKKTKRKSIANSKNTKKTTNTTKPVLRSKKNSTTINESGSVIAAAPQTTTVILREEHENIIDIEHDSDTYFTRTGIVQLSKDDLDEEMYDVEIEDDQEESDVNYDSSTNDNNNNNNKKFNNSIKNKIKRLRSSLNIEVVDDSNTNYISDNFNIDYNNNNANNNVNVNEPQTTVFHLVNLSENIV